ncbi:MAG: phosphate uptake regulator PhoU [Candidatus Bathyarchaeota archaeon]|nr:MAG: phosphate uptake regulator PhoU [Candidatus Bathyarchaeota archaeon]
MEQDLGYRRIQRTGRGSYIVSLPKEWVLSSELEKGSQLAFKIQEDSSLLLVPRNVLEEHDETKAIVKEYMIHVTRKDVPQSISRRIMSLYVISADSIRIICGDEEITSEQKTAIKNTVKMLLGTEVVSETSKEITIQILINHPEFPIETALRRMSAIATIMDNNAVSALKDFDENLIQDVIDSDTDLDRLNLYVIRQLKYGVERNLSKEMGFESPKEFLGYRIVAKNLENVGDNAVGTAKNVLTLKRLLDDQTLILQEPMDEEVYSSVCKLNSFSHRLLEDSLRALFKRDYHLADETISQFMSTGLELEKDAFNLMLYKSMDPNVASVLRLVIDNARKMMEYGRDIAEVTLNRTVEEISVQ